MQSDHCTSLETHRRSGIWTPVNGTRLFSVKRGQDEGRPPLLFLHGIPTWSWLWRNVLPVTAVDACSIAVDLPGFGWSDPSLDGSFRVGTAAAKVLAFLDLTFGEDVTVSLVVHDFGALVGAEMIRQAPGRIDRLVVTNTSLQSDSWTGGGLLTLLGIPLVGPISMWLARPWMLKRAMQPFLADPLSLSPEQFVGYWSPFEQGFGQSLTRMYQQRVVTPDLFELWRETLQSYRGRSLLLWGACDPAFGHDVVDIQGLLPDSNVVIFENASHFLPEERPRACGRLISAFLRE